MTLIEISTMTQLYPISRSLIARHDPDRYFLSLLMPIETGACLWPLLAFYHEIARTRDMVTDTTMGLIRLQWWKDAFNSFYSNGIIAPHEIFPELAAIIHRYHLPQSLFMDLLFAREFDVEDRVPSNFEGMLNYIRFTHTPLLKLCAKINNDDMNEQSLDHLSLAYGMIGLLRSCVFHAHARRCYLPQDLFQSLDDFYEGRNGVQIKPIAQKICDESLRYLDTVNPQTPYFKGMKVLTKIYIQQIRKCDYDVLSPEFSKPLMFKQLRVWWASHFA